MQNVTGCKYPFKVDEHDMDKMLGLAKVCDNFTGIVGEMLIEVGDSSS